MLRERGGELVHGVELVAAHDDVPRAAALRLVDLPVDRVLARRAVVGLGEAPDRVCALCMRKVSGIFKHTEIQGEEGDAGLTRSGTKTSEPTSSAMCGCETGAGNEMSGAPSVNCSGSSSVGMIRPLPEPNCTLPISTCIRIGALGRSLRDSGPDLRS